MKVTKDEMLTEIGRFYMETVALRRALSDQQGEAARMATEVGSLRQRHAKLSATAMRQEENLIALNTRLMSKAAPRETERSEAD